jgi:hypothetical protein
MRTVRMHPQRIWDVEVDVKPGERVTTYTPRALVAILLR